jgi:hypothetical protein
MFSNRYVHYSYGNREQFMNPSSMLVASMQAWGRKVRGYMYPSSHRSHYMVGIDGFGGLFGLRS